MFSFFVVVDQFIPIGFRHRTFAQQRHIKLQPFHTFAKHLHLVLSQGLWCRAGDLIMHVQHDPSTFMLPLPEATQRLLGGIGPRALNENVHHLVVEVLHPAVDHLRRLTVILTPAPSPQWFIIHVQLFHGLVHVLEAGIQLQDRIFQLFSPNHCHLVFDSQLGGAHPVDQPEVGVLHRLSIIDLTSIGKPFLRVIMDIQPRVSLVLSHE